VLLSGERETLASLIGRGLLSADSDIFSVISKAGMTASQGGLTVSSVVDRDGNLLYWMERFIEKDAGYEQ